MNNYHLTLLASIVLFSTEANAHGIWFAQRSDEMAFIYGHGAEDANSVKRQSKVTGFKAYSAEGHSIEGRLRATDYLLLAHTNEPAASFSASLDNGYWSQDSDGKWLNKGKDEVVNAKTSGRYLKYTVSYRGIPTQLAPLLLDQRLQILPLTYPFPTHRNALIKLRVLLDGKPAANVKVIQDYVNDPNATALRSDKHGHVSLRIRNQGLNVIAAAIDTAPDDAVKADKLGFFATLAFVLPHHED